MIRLLACLILVTTTLSSNAQRYRNPKSYIRQFENQKRKISIKNMRYLKSSLKNEDVRKVNKMREMVITQLRDSKKEIQKVGPYKDYDILQREFIKSMDIYLESFDGKFAISDSLRENMFRSYANLKKYYEAVEEAENVMLDAADRVDAAIDHFARTYYVTLIPDEELEEQNRMLDEVTLYARDMTLSFFRVQAEAKAFVADIVEGNNDSLRYRLVEMKKAIKTSTEEVQEYADFDGESGLYDELAYYLEEMENEINENLKPLAQKLEMSYLDEDEAKDVNKEYDRFLRRNEKYAEDFFDVRNAVILEYLPDA